MSNPSHKPTEGTRAQVDALAGLVGLPQAEIAAFLSIDLKTLPPPRRSASTVAAY